MDLQSQLDISKNLLQSLQTLTSSFDRLKDVTMTQTQKIAELTKSLKGSKQLSDNTVAKSQKMQKDLNESASSKSSSKAKKDAENTTEAMNKSLSQAEKSNRKRRFFSQTTTMFFKKIKSVAVDIFLKVKQNQKLNNMMSAAVNKLKEFPKVINVASKGLALLNLGLSLLNKIKDGIMTGGFSLIKDIPIMLLNLAKSGLMIIANMIGNITKFFMAITALPFTIAKVVSGLGFKIRQQMNEIINAGESAKETFDMTSDIGKGVTKLTGIAGGMLKTFESPRSRLVKLFGLGTAGATAFLNEIFKSVEGMGHYGEIFGASILGSAKSAQYILEAQKAMQLSGEELSYFALEAYNSGLHPIDVLHETTQLLDKAATDNEMDFVGLTKGFKKLRTNITDFGHLTSNEIVTLTTKLRKMRVSTDDAIGVFKKFSSLEEASKASAMLFQSFNMNIDAFDLLTSRDPEEMMRQLRDAMLATGRSFKDLDRHEKALLQSTTGISEQGLSAMMNHMNNGLSYQQARQKISDQDPTDQQTKMISSLSSTIKMFHKTLEFKSPFDAFFRGLTNNAANQKGLMESVMDLSKIYEDIYHLGLSFNLDEIKSLLGPINAVLSKINLALTGTQFKNALASTTYAVSEALSDTAYDLRKTDAGKAYHAFGYKIRDVVQNFGKSNEKAVNSAGKSALDVMKNYLNLTNPDRAGAKSLIIKSLKEKGLLKKLSKKSLKFAENISIKKANNAMASIADEYKDHPEIQRQLNILKDKVFSKYDTEIGKIPGLVVETLTDKSNNRKTIKGRIDHLYEVFSDAFKEGSSSFKMIFGIGSSLMGSIIRGIMYGTASALRLFAGSADVAAEQLGIKIPKGSKGAGIKGFTILDALGIKKEEYSEMSQEFGKESTNLAKQLPTFMSIATGFVTSLSSAFVEFGLGILGVFASHLYEHYEKSGMIMKGLMRTAGFDVQEAARLSNKSMGYDQGANLKKGTFNDSGLVDAMMTKDGSVKESYIGTFIDTFNNLYSQVAEGSPTYQFLSSKNVKNTISYVSNAGNFKKFDITGSFWEDADEPQRAQAILDIINTAYEIEEQMPQSVYKIASKKGIFDKNNKNFDQGLYNYYDAGLSIGLAKEKKLKDYKNIGDVFGKLGSAEYSAFENRTFNKLDKVSISANRAKLSEGKLLKSKALQVNDANLSAEETILLSGNKIVKFHKEDVIAVKKGGYLNQLFISVSEHFNDFAESLYQAHYTALDILFPWKDDVIAYATASANSIFSSDKEEYTNDEVSNKEMLDLFNLSLDLVEVSANRKPSASETKVKFI